jgi:DNA polymerase-1
VPSGPAPLLLAVDGDSLVHRAHHAMAGSDDRDAGGRPVWALRGLTTFIASAAARLRPDALVVGFDCRAHSVRKSDYALYKAQRADKHPDLAAQIEAAPELLAAAGLCVAVVRGFEADDVLASSAALARREGWRATLVTSDRDSFALVDDTTSVLRLINGGVDASPVITPRALAAAYGVTPAQYRDYAALRGDTSDNLPGVLGIGRTLAARLLTTFGTLDDAYAALEDGRTADVAAVVGAIGAGELAGPAAREAVVRNRRLMAMRADLPVPALEAMRLPLDRDRVRTVLRARGILLGPSLWALLGEAEPSWLGLGGYDRAPSYLPGARAGAAAGAEEPAARRDWRADAARLLAARAQDPSRTSPQDPAAGPAAPGRPAPLPRRAPTRPRGLPRPVPAGQLPLF